MITTTTITSGNINAPIPAFHATVNGLASGAKQTSAVTTMAICNIGTPDFTDESVESATINIHVVKYGQVANKQNLIVSNLIVPAGETVFFTDERLILDRAPDPITTGGDSIHIASTPGEVDISGDFIPGRLYIIETTGGTDYTLLGAANSSPGTVFEATGNGSGNGSGTARRVLLISTVSSLIV
jgi:hypothetical protein